jgi:hypothetical protein
MFETRLANKLHRSTGRVDSRARRWSVITLLAISVTAALGSQPGQKTKSPAASKPQAQAVLDATRRDYGDVFEGEELEHVFNVRNTGDAVLTLAQLKPTVVVQRKRTAQTMTPPLPSFNEPRERRGAKYKLVPVAARRAAPS